MLAVAGCGNQATVVLRDGSTLKGRIVENRDGVLVTENDAKERVEIPERSISDIEHPGTALLITGGALLGVGSALLVAAAAIDCSQDSSLFGCEMGRIMIGFQGAGVATSGLGLTIYGLHVR